MLTVAGVSKAPVAKADEVEFLSVPSPSMGRDITVQFQGGGPHAVYLLDGMRAQDDRSGWDINTDAFAQFNGSSVSVVMPGRGRRASTDWYGPAIGNGTTQTYKWETFLTSELPGGCKPTAASIRAAMPWSVCRCPAVPRSSSRHITRAISSTPHPCRDISTIRRPWPFMVGLAMAGAGGFNAIDMWGINTNPAWKRNDPTVQVGRLVSNNTRIWIYNGNGTPTDMDPAAEADPNVYWVSSWRASPPTLHGNSSAAITPRAATTSLQLSPNGIHSWGYWGGQLIAMKPDIQRVLGVPAPPGEHWAAAFPDKRA